MILSLHCCIVIDKTKTVSNVLRWVEMAFNLFCKRSIYCCHIVNVISMKRKTDSQSRCIKQTMRSLTNRCNVSHENILHRLNEFKLQLTETWNMNTARQIPGDCVKTDPYRTNETVIFEWIKPCVDVHLVWCTAWWLTAHSTWKPPECVICHFNCANFIWFRCEIIWLVLSSSKVIKRKQYLMHPYMHQIGIEYTNSPSKY